jgi:hypothetical protein
MRRRLSDLLESRWGALGNYQRVVLCEGWEESDEVGREPSSDIHTENTNQGFKKKL